MDVELERRRNSGELPFEKVLHSEDLMPLSELHDFLSQVIGPLKAIGQKTTLQLLDDWHEHDGYLTSPKEIEWQQLEKLTISTAELYKSRCSDTHVKRAYYTSDYKFLLRFGLLEEDEDIEFYPGIWGDIDISGSYDILAMIHTKLSENIKAKFIISEASEFFRKRYAG